MKITKRIIWSWWRWLKRLKKSFWWQWGRLNGGGGGGWNGLGPGPGGTAGGDGGGESLLLLLSVGSCLSLNLFNLFLVCLALVLSGQLLIFFPNKKFSEKRTNYWILCIKSRNIFKNKAFCLCKIFLLIGSSFWRSEWLMSVWMPLVKSEVARIFLYVFRWYIWIICNSSKNSRPYKIIDVISQIPVKTANISSREIFQIALLAFIYEVFQ